MTDAIVVSNLGKRFRRYNPHRPRTLQEAVLGGLRRLKPGDYFWGLRHVSFKVAAGSAIGVIGQNGAGKSTLLRLIGGVGRPEEGRVEVQGRIGALLDLGASFHPDLTGRENVFVSGVIGGLTRREVEQRFEAIVAFAELEAFIDNPLRTYSTGMQMRLAFSVAAHIEPDILLIDEVLAVGDLAFQRKCLERIARFKARGCTILLVSHDAQLVRELCDEAIWLREGESAAHGAADVVVGQYVAAMRAETKRRTPGQGRAVRTAAGTELRINENRFGSLEMAITGVRLLDPDGQPVTEIDSGDPLRVEIGYHAPAPIEAPIFGVTISREDGLVCFDGHTSSSRLTLPRIQGPGQIALQLERLDLNGGAYFVDVGVYRPDWAYAFDYHWHVYPLLVRQTGNPKGVLHPPHRWDVGEWSTPLSGVQPLEMF